MVKKLILVLLSVVGIAAVAVVAIAASKPDNFRFERKAVINARPERITPLISNFHEWPRWSPWEKLDPGMKRTYSGPESGVGAVYEWDGNNDAGQGRMEITEVTGPNDVRLKLDFIKPFAASNTVTFSAVPLSDTQSQLTWTMEGKQELFPCKIFSVFMSMDDMCGKDFDSGLAGIKSIAEKQEVASKQNDG
jgi:hypothetical protein